MSVAAAMERLAAPLSGADVLLVCDFDGTLARRQADSWSARILPGSQRALRHMAGSEDISVAFLSGRGALDLAERTRVGGAQYLGDHGAERAHAARGFRAASLAVSTWAARPEATAAIAALATHVPRIIDEDWLAVEHKHAGVAFHFRRAPDIVQARTLVMAAVERVDDGAVLVRTPSGRSVELRAPGAPSKATAMVALIEEQRPTTVIALGDDRNDADAWRAMRIAAGRTGIQTVAIAVASVPDVTAAIAPQADILLPSPDTTASLLGRMARQRVLARS